MLDTLLSRFTSPFSFNRVRASLAGMVFLFCGIFQVSCSAVRVEAESPEVRALWVTRWDYRKPEDIRMIVENAAAVGFNTLYFQVRGEATCFFPSSVEPWAWELSGNMAYLGRNPGWDPLALAIREAHRRGLKIQAYLNVLPVWKQKTSPPKASGHIAALHPEWIMVEKSGKRMSVNNLDFYAFLNPAIPEARNHIVSVFEDVARRYKELDGIHLDYIRLPSEVGEFSYDAYSLADFKRWTGGASPASEPTLWNRYRCLQINTLVTQITMAVRKANPHLEISAAVFANYESAVTTKAQRWLEWPDRNLIDTAVPMAYHYNMDAYQAFLTQFLGKERPRRGKIVVGIYPAEKWRKGEGYTFRTLVDQIEAARRDGADGVALFSYAEFFPDHKPTVWAQYLKSTIFQTAP